MHMSKRLASKALRPAILGSRSYATPAALEFAVSESNGIKIAASDDHQSPTSALSVVLKAGPRFESAPGLAHVLKNFVFRATNRRSAIRLIRETEIYGGVLSTALTKEHVYLTAEFLRGEEEYFAQLLGEIISEPKLARHEFVEDVVPQVESEYAQALGTPQVYALDVAHQLAFRNGLGNSLFASPHSEVSLGAATSYIKQTFSNPSNIALVGSNVDASSLTSLVGDYFALPAGSASPTAVTKPKYYGGESRLAATGHGGHGSDVLLVAFQGAPASSPEYSVLRHLLGGEPAVKWSQGATGFSTTAPGAVAFNLGYSDAGLVGFTISAPTEKVEGIAQKAVAELKRVAKGSLAEADVKRAVTKAKLAAASAYDSNVSKLELIGAQLLTTGAPKSLSTSFSELDKVTGDAIAKAAAAALKSTPTVVAIGNTHKLPYADSLGL